MKNSYIIIILYVLYKASVKMVMLCIYRNFPLIGIYIYMEIVILVECGSTQCHELDIQSL